MLFKRSLTTLTLRSPANASQSLRHASFRAEGETDRFVARASFSTGNGANAAHGNCELVIGEGFKDLATPLAQMPALRPMTNSQLPWAAFAPFPVENEARATKR